MTKSSFGCALAGALLLFTGLVSPAGAGSSELFTVADSIQMTRWVDPSDVDAPLGRQTFKFSPDQTKVVVVTKKGSLRSGHNEFTLWLLRTDQVQRYLRASGNAKPASAMEPLVTFETTGAMDGIDRLTWLRDGLSVAFIGRREDSVGQVYLYNFERQTLSQLTHHPHNIVLFDLASEAGPLVFAAETPEDWSARNKFGYAVRSEYVGRLQLSDPAQAPREIRHFIGDTATHEARPIQLSPSKYPGEISVSPDGRYAIMTVFGEWTLPRAWLEYEPVRKRIEAVMPVQKYGVSALDDIDNEAFGGRLNWVGRRFLVDLGEASARELVDAPVLIANTSMSVVWPRDGNHVIVGATLLPLAGLVQDTAERERRRKFAAIAEVDLSSHQATRIMELAEGSSIASMRLMGAANLVVDLRTREHDHDQVVEQQFRKLDEQWQRSKPRQRTAARPNLVLTLKQDVNTPPELWATDHAGHEGALTDLNPQLRAKLRPVEPFTWRDSQDREFHGGLLVPRGYQAGTRYPLVIQTYGFNLNAFLADGPLGITSAYAARPLADAGLVVLQMDTLITARTSCHNWEECGENPAFLAMVESAIDALDSRAIIDRDRVGLIGWSRDGMHAFHTLVFGKYAIAAATVADSIAFSPFGYALVYGAPYPGLLEFERMIGGRYWGESVSLWNERSAALHLDRIRTPLRLEAYGAGISNYWDVFANLKRNRRPVELIHIPLEEHLLRTPYGRYTSQQGNVDWFRFWLLGEVDDDPAKVDQYRRWSRLKAQQQAVLESQPAPPTSNESPQ